MSDTTLDHIHRNVLSAGHRVVHDSVPAAIAEEKYGWLLVDAGRPSMPFLNGAAPLGSVDVSTVGKVEMWFEERNSTSLFRLRVETDQPIIDRLKSSGYVMWRTEQVLHMPDPDPPVIETPLEIVEVKSLDRLGEIVGRIGGTESMGEFGYSMSLKTLTMSGTAELWGLLDDQLVAGAIVLVTSSMAGIYAVFVNEEYRRQGFGTAITWAAIRSAQSLGARSVWLGSTEMALSMYLLMGFTQIGEYQMLAQREILKA